MTRMITIALCAGFLLTAAAALVGKASAASAPQAAAWPAAAQCDLAAPTGGPDGGCTRGRCSYAHLVGQKSVGPTFPMACRPTA
jgi:hypothetical protein